MAHIWVFIRMQSLVHVQCGRVTESLFTVFALKRLFSGVCAKMYVQTIACAEGARTLRTENKREIQIYCVSSTMQLKIKEKPRKLPFVRSFPRMPT